MNEDELEQRNKLIKEFEHKIVDEKETILFAIEKSGEQYVVITSKNPRIMVGKATKFEAVACAFNHYLKRLAEIEGVQITTDSEVSETNETTST